MNNRTRFNGDSSGAERWSRVCRTADRGSATTTGQRVAANPGGVVITSDTLRRGSDNAAAPAVPPQLAQCHVGAKNIAQVPSSLARDTVGAAYLALAAVEC
jgi:hypothetical protein